MEPDGVKVMLCIALRFFISLFSARSFIATGSKKSFHGQMASPILTSNGVREMEILLISQTICMSPSMHKTILAAV